MDLSYLPADLARDIDLAVQFRKDTHLVSFGHTKDFDTARQAKVFHLFQQDWPLGLLHVWLGDEIIGQVEFTTPIKQADGSYWGYVYLFYLKPDYRGRGIGQQIHDFVIQKMQADNC
ncbi:GNAT family N-acetyltransferase [Catenovulum maritimum]|uniref:GNAT family N-acetyltransferase n=1 Tax=Catenovulum maritimum TaxID=1513271 RepID=UPI00066062F0|nr:GNAT family N-acetyltransferase [Catenovulum maritimum]